MIRDREQYESLLQGFVGRTCRRTIACNSIKLRFEEIGRAAGRGYIWVDPPWVFMHHQQLVTDAYLCPHHEDTDYTPKFQEWCNLFSPLDQTVFMGYEFSYNESLSLFFSNSYKLYIPQIETEPEDIAIGYSHWYASQIKNVG